MKSVPPIVISYRPKKHDYLPVVVAAIRHHLGDWPVTLVCERHHIPSQSWRTRFDVKVITDWDYSPDANKVRRLWDHAEIISDYFDAWIWWHDDMLLLRPLADPVQTFSQPRVRADEAERPNKKLSNWHCWLWDTLSFFQCQGIAAPNPVLHVPRLISKTGLERIPANWDRSRLLFEPTYLLWNWHLDGVEPYTDDVFRQAVFEGGCSELGSLEQSGSTIFCWGRQVGHAEVGAVFSERYSLSF